MQERVDVHGTPCPSGPAGQEGANHTLHVGGHQWEQGGVNRGLGGVEVLKDVFKLLLEMLHSCFLEGQVSLCT